MNKQNENKLIQHLEEYIDLLTKRLENEIVSFEEWSTCYREFKGSLLINEIQKEKIYKLAQALINSNVLFDNKIEEKNIITTKKTKIKNFISTLDASEDKELNLMSIYNQIKNKNNKSLILIKK